VHSSLQTTVIITVSLNIISISSSRTCNERKTGLSTSTAKHICPETGNK